MDKETLKQYRDLNKEIKHISNDINNLRNQYRSPSQASAAPAHSNIPGDPTGKIAALCADLEISLASKMADLVLRREEIEISIKNLPSRERDILRLRYIMGWTWRKISFELDYSEDYIKHLHGWALQKICKS